MKTINTLYCKKLLLAATGLILLISCSTSSPLLIDSEQGSRSFDKHKASLVVQQAKAMLGQPYRYGGSKPGQGFDCSGLVFFSHKKFKKAVPRTSKAQFQQAKKISLRQLKPGDLLFYKTNSTPSHVTIYIGKRQFIHAPSSGKKVMIASMDNPYFKSRLVAAGRLY